MWIEKKRKIAEEPPAREYSVLGFDLRGLFDDIRHDYLEMVKRHTREK